MDLLQQKNIAANPEFIEFFEIKHLESKRRDHFYLAQQELRETKDELACTKTAKFSLEQQVSKYQTETAELKEKLALSERQANIFHTENTVLLQTKEELQIKLRAKELQVLEMLVGLKKLIQENE